MSKKALLVFVIFIFIATSSIAQSSEFKTQRAQLAVFNIGLNGLIGGVGSLINNNDGQANFRTFARGFYKGAIGGGISHIGLSMAHQIDKQQSMALAWPVRMVNSLGSSIIQNAAEDKRMFERLHFNLYLTRLEFFPYQSQKKFKARLFTSSVYGLLVVGKGARFDLGKTLLSGIMYFESDGRFSSSIGSGRATGQVSSIGIRSDLEGAEFYDTFAEEVAHIMQYDRKVGGNALMKNIDTKWRESSTFYKSLSKYIYLDLNGPVFWLAYTIENSTSCNFFEQEAVNYANKRLDDCR
ncbi:hypothetical protein [Tunicatimonas pelagia]|uniref:hypothetical protein n=1 Tax=Tunicatimonas pelagia TaxID=931531 RepID=UPI0026652DC9|nr:hypothetical protein [Tunicatimonas pelagia]WKN41162.1 hypothetical protein P0M28_19185 [Tunicatimonas pelagia]